MLMRPHRKLGMASLEQFRALRHAAAVVGTAFYFTFLPRSWNRKNRAHLVSSFC